MPIGNHLGTSFEIWSGRQTWFWFVVNCRCDGAVIGAAANEAEAIREACLSIEEMAARRSHTAESPRFNKKQSPRKSRMDSSQFGRSRLD
jgi:hypothetical protein